MPRVASFRAIATRASIEALWHDVEVRGERTILLPTLEAVKAVRNKLYAHRAALRKKSRALNGLEASHLDGYTFDYHKTTHPNTGAECYSFTITTGQMIEFEVLVWDDEEESSLHYYDLAGVRDEEPPLEPHTLDNWE